MEVKRYYVSAERGQRVNRFWFRTEEEARDKLTDLLAARGSDWAEGRLGSVAREGDRVGVSVLKYMELKDYTEEQLRAELKRRYDERQKERESIKRCRHCEYMQRFKDYDLYNCRVRTFTRKNRYDKNNPIVVHYSVKKSDKACDKFKQKENQDGK